MRLQRIPQRGSNCLSPFSSHFNCPQGQHFRVWCWLLVTLLLVDEDHTQRQRAEKVRNWEQALQNPFLPRYSAINSSRWSSAVLSA